MPTPDPQTTAATNDVGIGFTFNLFGNAFSQVNISPSGNVSAGGALIQAFDGNRNFPYAWQLLADPSALAGGAIVDGFRVCWNCDLRGDPENSSFQLGLFDLGGDNFVIEFNFNTLLPGDAAAAPFLGYDNGNGSVYDLLASTGLALGGSSIPDCLQSASSLPCDSWFDPALSGFADAAVDYFRQDPEESSEKAIGRYVFVIANEAPDNGGGGGDDGTPPPTNGDTQAVPEPSTSMLLLLGLAALGAAGRQRRRRTS